MNKVVLGSALDKLRELPSESVHCMVTSPPYWGLRAYSTTPQIWGGDKNCKHEWIKHIEQAKGGKNHPDRPSTVGGNRHMSETKIRGEPLESDFCRICGAWRGELGLEPTPELYIGHLVEIMREVKRVLRDDGTIWIIIGDSYNSSPPGNTNPMSKSGLHGAQTSQKYRERLEETQQHQQEGRKLVAGLKPKDLVGIPWMLAFALRADGWWLRSDIIFSKNNPMPESVTDRPTKSHEYIFLLSKSKKYFYDADAIREDNVNPKRTNYKPGKEAYMEGNIHGPFDDRIVRNEGFKAYADGKVCVGRNKRSVWNINTQPYPDAHFAVFPTEIPRLCISAGTSEEGCCSSCGAPHERITEKGFTSHDGSTESLYEKGSSGGRISLLRQAAREQGFEYQPSSKTVGWRATCNCNAKTVPCTVLDPFAGSGTTGEVAKRLGRNYVLIELNPEYKTLIEKRLASVTFNEGYHTRGSTPDVNKNLEAFI